MHNSTAQRTAARTIKMPQDEIVSLKPSYERIVLLANAEDAESFGIDQHSLFITYDWLLCQTLREAGYDIIHYEAALLDWELPHDFVPNLNTYVNAWVFDDGKDMTEFRGISLGKCFTSEMTLCQMNFLRLDYAIRHLIKITGCSVVIYRNFATEFGVLNADQRQMLVRNACADMGVRYEGPAEGLVNKSNVIRELQFRHKPVTLRERLAQAYAVGLSLLSRLRAGNKRPKVLLLANTNMLKALIMGYKRGGVTPVVQARTIPRKRKYLSWIFKQGICAITMTPSKLDKETLDEINALRKQIEEHLEHQSDEIPRPVAAFIQQRFLQTDKLEQYVADLLTAEINMRKIRPARLIVDGVRNPPNRLYVEIAYRDGIPIDYIWHGPHVPMKDRNDALCGDMATPPRVTRVLSWGEVNDEWLDDIGYHQERVRVGSPLAQLYANQPKPEPAKTGHDRKALLLQYDPMVQDLRGLNVHTFNSLINTAFALRRQGFDEIRVKMHPGPNKWEPSYFKAVIAYFGLDCPVYKYEPFHDMVKWADIVVGPLASGAMFETLAAGKPYYPFMIEPHSMDSRYYGDYLIFRTVDEFENALKNNVVPEGRHILNQFYSIDSISDTVGAFWEAAANFEDTSKVSTH